MEKIILKNPILAHRGITFTGHLENSYNSLFDIKKYASNLNKLVNKLGIEFDIQYTKSGNIVCYHDHNLKRLHNDDINVYDLTPDIISKYGICNFIDIIKEFTNSPYMLDIEMKSYDSELNIPEFCKQVEKLIMDYNFINNTVVSSFDINIVTHMLKTYPHINTVFLIYGETSDDIINKLIDIGLKGIAMDKYQYEKTDYYISKGLNVMIYTLFNTDDSNDYTIVKYLSKYDNVVLITDRIDKLL